jgi:imidazolonepropionase-like amidohydrolase
MLLETKIGSVEVAKYADLVVWDRNPCQVSTNDFLEDWFILAEDVLAIQ